MCIIFIPLLYLISSSFSSFLCSSYSLFIFFPLHLLLPSSSSSSFFEFMYLAYSLSVPFSNPHSLLHTASLYHVVSCYCSYTGHMRFIGELYMYGLVNQKVMRYCIMELVNSEEVSSCHRLCHCHCLCHFDDYCFLLDWIVM